MNGELSVHIAEYNAIRSEICAFHNVEGQVMSITVALIGALLAYFNLAQDHANGSNIFDSIESMKSIHLIPLPFAALGVMFCYNQVRIVQAASYLHNVIRENIRNSLDGAKDNVILWESYRRNSEVAPYIHVSTFLNFVRWTFFISPSLIPFISWNRSINSFGDVFLIIWDISIPVVLIFLSYWSVIILPKRVI
ncbi:hypothetical protein [Azospirillum palustre]